MQKEGNQPASKANRLHTRGLRRRKVERETGSDVPSTNARVEFSYRLA